MRYFDLAAKVVVGPPTLGALATLRRLALFVAADIEPLYAARHGVNRGIQRGTLVRKLSYSVPNVCLSVGSSYITTTT